MLGVLVWVHGAADTRACLKKVACPNRPALFFRTATVFVFISTCPQLVWSAFKEIRRPQLSLVRDLISGALHPVALAMPELVGAHGVSGKVSGLVRAMYCSVAHAVQAVELAVFGCFVESNKWT